MDDIIEQLRRTGLNEQQVARVAPFLGMDDLLNALNERSDRSGDLIDILEQTIRDNGNILGSGHEVLETGIPLWRDCTFTLTQDIPTMSLSAGTSFTLMSAQKPREKGVKRGRGEVNTNPKYILVLLRPGKLAWLFEYSGRYYLRLADQRESRRVQLYSGTINCPSAGNVAQEEPLPDYSSGDEEMPDARRRRMDRQNYVIPPRRNDMDMSFGKRRNKRNKRNNKEMTLKTINKLIKELKKM